MHATEMKTKRHYTSPVTQRATVELEGGFCSSISEQGVVVRSTKQEYEEIDAKNAFSGTESDSDGNFNITWE